MHWRLAIVALLICAMLIPVIPAYAAPSASPGPGDADQLIGVQSGTLEAGKDHWFTFWDGGTSKPLGVAMSYAPAYPGDDPQVTFIVWIYTKEGLDSKLAQIGRGTAVEQASGMKYWRGGSNIARNYLVQVVNNSAASIDYSITLAGDVYPPPFVAGSDTAARDILTKAMSSAEKVNTVKADIDMGLTVNMTNGGESMAIAEMAMAGQATIDHPNKRMKMNMKISMQSPKEDSIDMEFYILGKWMYIKMASATGIPELDQTWMKAPHDEQIWSTWASQHTWFTRQAAKVSLAGTQNIDGTPCYVLDIKPGKEAIQAMLSQQPMGGAGDELARLGLDRLFDTVSLKAWVAKDTHLILKQEMSWPMEIKAGDLDSPLQSSEKLTMNLDFRMKLYDYNQPVSIQLPPEAADAEELPGGLAPVPGARPPR